MTRETKIIVLDGQDWLVRHLTHGESLHIPYDKEIIMCRRRAQGESLHIPNGMEIITPEDQHWLVRHPTRAEQFRGRAKVVVLMIISLIFWTFSLWPPLFYLLGWR